MWWGKAFAVSPLAGRCTFPRSWEFVSSVFHTWEGHHLATGGRTARTTCRLTSSICRFADCRTREEQPLLHRCNAIRCSLRMWNTQKSWKVGWRRACLTLAARTSGGYRKICFLNHQNNRNCKTLFEVEGTRPERAGNGREFINWRV